VRVSNSEGTADSSTAWVRPRDGFLGQYRVNAKFNCGGCSPAHNPVSPSDGNPYQCVGAGAGPIVIPSEPGRYRVVHAGWVRQGGNPRVWSGDAATGAGYYMPHAFGGTVEFEHAGGNIVL
jgi:hypothetical protein